MLVVRRLASVADACAVGRCAGASLDRCAFVEVRSGPKTWRFAGLPLLTPRGLRRRSQASIDASCVQMTREPGLLVPYATLAIIWREAKGGLFALLPSLAERIAAHLCSTRCWAPSPAL